MTELTGGQHFSDAALVGQVLGGDYLIEERVGQGGMAFVYRGSHKRLGGEVAVKILFSHFLDDEGLRTRFLREARSQYTLNHPNIVRVLDFIEESGVVGFVSEWCDAGELLRWWGPRNGVLSLERFKMLLFPVLEAMSYAHAQGIVHRDLKPQNIMIQYRGETIVPKVTDFGIAKFAQKKGLTRPGMMVGTLQYMAPEQLEGRQDADHRADIYSLGVIMYQMLSGHLPFVGDSMSLVMKVLEFSPPALPDAHIPGPVGDVVMRCLSKDPKDRYLSCDDVKAALQSAIERCDDAISLTDFWQERVRAHHSLDTEGEVSLAGVGVDVGLIPGDETVCGEDEAGTVPSQTSPDAPVPQPTPLPKASRSPSRGRMTQTLPPTPAPASKWPAETMDGPAAANPMPKRTAPMPEEVPRDASTAPAVSAPVKASMARPIPVGLEVDEFAAEGGGGKSVLVGFLLLVCGIVAGGVFVFQRQDLLSWWPPSSGTLRDEKPSLTSGSGRVDAGVMTPRTPTARLALSEKPASRDGGAAVRRLPVRARDRALTPMAKARLDCRRGDGKACDAVGRDFLSKAKKTPQAGQVKVLASQARHWLYLACEEEHAPACRTLGIIHRSGFGGRIDGAKARAFFRRACEARLYDACLSLGTLYEKVLGGPYDASQAIAFYRKACDGNIAAGCRMAGKVWQRRLDKQYRDCKRAQTLWQKACRMGDRAACAMRCEGGKPG